MLSEEKYSATDSSESYLEGYQEGYKAQERENVFLAIKAGLSKEMSVRDSLEYAKCAAALSTTKKGAQSSIPTPEEVAEHLA